VNPGSRKGDTDKLYYDWEMILELEPIILLQHGCQSIQTLHNRGGLGYDMLLEDMFCIRSVSEIESQINKYGGRKELLMKLGILKKLE
jgi:hypothetical protein